MRTEPTPRTIRSAEYTPSSERSDGFDWLLGDVTYVRTNECDHLILGNPSMHYKVGSGIGCRQCTKETA